jgi:hypothetical protein
VTTSVLPAPADTPHEPIDELIARVLRRVHRAAEDLNMPGDARVILHVARSFADELAATNPEFDRLEFVRSVTDGDAA